LTTRESDVLALIIDSLSDARDSASRFVTKPTAESHIGHLLTKTGVRHRAEAVTYACRHGLTREAD